MLSSDLAPLYEVTPKVLLQAVRRNIDRFPSDFMFQLTSEEWNSLRSQIVTLENAGKGKHIKYLPFAFTQEGIAMLSSVLKSPRAIQVNIAIMRAFVRLRELMISHHDLSQKIESLERKYNSQFRVVFNSIRELITAKPNELPAASTKRKIGFGN